MPTSSAASMCVPRSSCPAMRPKRSPSRAWRLPRVPVQQSRQPAARSRNKDYMAKQGALSGMNQGGLSELWGRLRFLFLAVIVYRISAHIPVPGINPDRLADMFRQNEGTILSLFNMFSGGALERMSIFALGIMPYISASIIMQLMTAVSPSLEQLKKEGDSGRRKISQYTRCLTLVLALIQAVGMSVGMASQGVAFNTGFGFYFIAVVTFVSGAMFMMWLGEQI